MEDLVLCIKYQLKSLVSGTNLHKRKEKKQENNYQVIFVFTEVKIANEIVS